MSIIQITPREVDLAREIESLQHQLSVATDTACVLLGENAALKAKLAEVEKEIQCMKAPRGFIEQPSTDGIVRTPSLLENK